MIVSRKAHLLMALLPMAVVAAAALPSSAARAQWWSRAPADFEACADVAEKATTKEARISGLSACHSKFAGRRKPGGGYAYFDFMQNRSFDIAGPNPTPEEQRYIDEQYTAFLDRERQSRIASELAAKKQQQQEQQQLSLRSEKTATPAPPPAKPRAGSTLALAAASMPPPATSAPKPRPKAAACARPSFSCEWPRLSDGINDLKKLLGASLSKARRS